ncbi:unnamed protein product [Orchesella dallaii]|uniref:Adenosine kinase n=1 Tax=Orchesella dallaii TaxID=48710 RepID=A0ABP1S1S3_9HEXA
MQNVDFGDYHCENESRLLVLGNLLLDMIAEVEDDYLKSYEVLPDTIQTAEKRHMKIYEEMKGRSGVKFSPGGSALNTIRMVQCILGYPKNVITLLGAVGSDETGKNLIELLENEGINTKMVQKVDNWPTGRCACLLTDGGSARTMVTDLGAATKFSHEEFMKKNVKGLEWMEKIKYVYVTGYFLKVSPVTVMEVVKHAANLDVPIILNLNAVWITTGHSKELKDLLPFVDILFGNESEVISFAGQLRVAVDSYTTTSDTQCRSKNKNHLSCIAIFFSSKIKQNGHKASLVVITRGEKPVLCANSNGEIKEYPINFPRNIIVDTTGAGDGFVGGFLAAYTKNLTVDKCFACAIWAASEVLKNFGFILPKHVPSQL